MTLTTGLIGEIQALKAERRAAILAHNYQIPAIQDLADVVADSLQMARRASELDAPLLVICGVQFMAETAAIANPDKRVVIPDLEAGCSLAATIHAEDVRAWRAEHPDGLVVAYVNCSAAVKAEADYCCTSGNAVAVVRSLPPDVPVLFVPDFFLGSYLRRVTGRDLDVWMGECRARRADAGRARGAATAAPRRRIPGPSGVRLRDKCHVLCRVRRRGGGGAGGDRFHRANDASSTHLERRKVRGRDGDGGAAPVAPREPHEAVPGGGRIGGVPLHENDHPREAARLAAGREVRGHGARGNRAPRPASHRTDAGYWLTPWAWRRCAGRWPRTAQVRT